MDAVSAQMIEAAAVVDDSPQSSAGTPPPPPPPPASSAPAADDMAAALALTGFAFSAPASSPPAAADEAPPPASSLLSIPGATESWPFAAGKGCFCKAQDGKDMPFLERLFLLLSLPNLSLPGHPGRRLGEAICWKSPESLAALGLPTTLAAFEIGNVALLEAAIYPQYASGARPIFALCQPSTPSAHLLDRPTARIGV